MAKNYIAEMATDDLDNSVLNPPWPQQRRDIGSVTKIVVHHEAVNYSYEYDDDARYESEARYQNTSSIPGSKGLQYHLRIDNVGLINQVRPLDVILWHAGNLDVNNHAIGICLDGNFENQVPTKEQYESLKQLLDWLCTEHPEFPAVQSDVYAHSEVIDKNYFPGGTACCGRNLRQFVVDYRNYGGSVAIPDVPYQHPELQPDNPASPPTQPPVVTPPLPEPTPVPQPTPQPEPAPTPTPPVVQPQPSPTPSVPIPITIIKKSQYELAVNWLGTTYGKLFLQLLGAAIGWVAANSGILHLPDFVATIIGVLAGNTVSNANNPYSPNIQK